jgi:hypothetical protein
MARTTGWGVGSYLTSGLRSGLSAVAVCEPPSGAAGVQAAMTRASHVTMPFIDFIGDSLALVDNNPLDA